MLQGYFLTRDHIYICNKFAHGPTEKDEVYRIVQRKWVGGLHYKEEIFLKIVIFNSAFQFVC